MAVIEGAEGPPGDAHGNGPLFAQIGFCIVPSKTLTDGDAHKVGSCTLTVMEYLLTS